MAGTVLVVGVPTAGETMNNRWRPVQGESRQDKLKTITSMIMGWGATEQRGGAPELAGDDEVRGVPIGHNA